MAKELFISTTPHETKVAVVEDEQLAEIYFERENEYTLAGSIYKGRVTRVLPGMQSAFVDIGLERDAFLYVTDFLEEQEDQEDFEQVVQRTGSDEQVQQSYQTASSSDEQSSPNSHSGTAEEPGGSDQQFERGPRRWRGRRGRRRGRGGFGEQGAHPQGEAESAAQEFEGAAEGEAGSDEPVILPGESLSKYRHAESQTESQEAERASPQQDTKSAPREQEGKSFAAPPTSASDNASLSVLPGESISKYRSRADAGPQPETSQRSSPPQERSRERGGRWQRPERRPERESSRHDEGPTGPPVFALPGESLAKYRREDSAAAAEVSPQVEQTEQAETMTASPVAVEQTPTEIQHDSPIPDSEDRSADYKVQRTEAEQSGAEERIEHVLQDLRPPSQNTQVESSAEVEAREEEAGSVAHQFGSGIIEEEVIDEEESDVLPIGDHLDEEIYEELEEETLDAENAEQLVEAVREAHVNQRLGLAKGEPSDLEDHPVGEEMERFPSENGAATDPQIEAAEIEDSADQEELGEHEEGNLEEEEVGIEGRAELRAPANTAGFQQRVERPERAPDRFRRGRRRPMRGRRNIQRESQPTISELLKEGQEILVQIAKEPMAKKGARITSHIALPGRFLVYMPTVNHVGVSRKIGSDEERQRLKRILISEKGSAHGGFIVRTAAAGASEEDLRSDLRFLINLWTDIKSRSENSKAPALIYHDLNLVERILRDQVTSNFAGIWVDNEQEYERIVRFLGRFQSAMVRRAKLYTKDTPLFEQFGIQEEINNALKSKVWLKSGGYIVINQTEALVAIDINTGKYVGKTQRLEDTIVKTNIDAIREIVRQIRLRDLGGIIVIDFIDMDERKNRQKVMQALEEALKADRAPSKVLQFNDFGLVAITRKRVKQSLERTLSTSCAYCTGTGMIKSVQTVCNEIYVEMRKMTRNLERHDVMLRVNPEVVKALKANNARWLQEMEELTGKTIIVKSDPLLHQEQFDINQM